MGVDPGLAGAIAVLDAHGTLAALADTPTLTLKVQRGTRQVYDVPGMAALLRSYAGHQCQVYIEEAQAMPGQGSRSMYTVGLGYGLWLGILASLCSRIPACALASGSARWRWGRTKKRLDGERCSSILVRTCVEKTHGRAEALLLAAYGLRATGATRKV